MRVIDIPGAEVGDVTEEVDIFAVVGRSVDVEEDGYDAGLGGVGSAGCGGG